MRLSGTSIAALLVSAALLLEAAAPGRLRVQGTRFLNPDGSTFQWRGITAFRLVDYVADGQEQRARDFLKWASGRHLTVVRVFAMLHGFFDLRPAEGRAALPRLLTLAASYGLQVEVVGLTNTAEPGLVDPRQQIQALSRIAAVHDNALLELANEPYHPTQSADVHRPDFLKDLGSLVPPSVPASLGSIEHEHAFAAGSYVTWHVPRRSSDDGWGHVLAIADGAQYPREFGKPVISDEPIGAGPKLQPGRRDDDPGRFRAAALLTRLAGLGATFHYESGPQARVPVGRELECFNAWNDAWTLLPRDIEQRGVFRRVGGDGAVVRAFDQAAALAAFERQDGDSAWVLVIRPAGDTKLRWSDGWHAVRTRRTGGVEIIAAHRRR